MQIWIKRAYEPPGKQDGTRVLVDRVWPRGISKQQANIHLWLKDIAPSDQLRKWFHHDTERWEDFRERYISELNSNETSLTELCKLTNSGRVTLVFGSRDQTHNNAVVLKEYLEHRC
ncbi:MAG: DUF488 domain-containing protein [Gammaproteobacteria bacterium]|jgi:uncharacterized protein YeaO (DUF488 family)